MISEFEYRLAPVAQRRQRGAVLVVSLVILVVITMIAAGSMRGTILEEKMAGNTRDRNLAFQAAESGVREAEIFIDNVASLGAFSGSGGLYGLLHTEPDYTADATWNDGSGSHVVAANDYGAYQAPKLYIKHYTTVTGTQGALNLSGYGDNKGTGDVAVFRIVTKATGASAESAEVLLRSYYGRAF